MKKRFIPVQLLALLLAATAFAFPNEPDGFDKARFGMTVDQLREPYPELKELAKEDRHTFPEVAPGVDVFYLRSQTLEGFEEPADVTFLVSDQGLFMVKVYPRGVDRLTLEERVREKHGPPTIPAGNPTWAGEKTLLSVYPKGALMEVYDAKRIEPFSRALLEKPSVPGVPHNH